jgi:hypothetical protein
MIFGDYSLETTCDENATICYSERFRAYRVWVEELRVAGPGAVGTCDDYRLGATYAENDTKRWLAKRRSFEAGRRSTVFAMRAT